MRSIHRTTLAAVLVMSLVACAGDSDDHDAAAVTSPAAEAALDAAASATEALTVGDERTEAPAETEAPAAAETAAPAELMAPDAATIEASGAAPVPQSSPRAGSVDDNAEFEDYLAYRQRIAALGIPLRDLDPTGRVTIRVTGPGGTVAAPTVVAVRDDSGLVAELTSLPDGTVRFHPNAYRSTTGTVTADAGAGPFPIRDGLVIESPSAAEAQGPVPVDVHFLLDATGSMGDELDLLTQSLDLVVSELDGMGADLRLGLTRYQDIGDVYLTQTVDLTADVDTFRAELAATTAGDGGDTPEAMDEALAEAVAAPSWRADAIKVMFLIADAPPHLERQLDVDYVEASRRAARKGIKIHPLAASGTDDQAEAVFRSVAQFTGGRFVFLSYGQVGSGAALGTSSDIDATDYEELPLDALLVRLVAEDLAARSGRALTIDPVISIDNGQGQ